MAEVNRVKVYASCRPTYPPELLFIPGAAIPLSYLFDSVVATDCSPEQISHAVPYRDEKVTKIMYDGYAGIDFPFEAVEGVELITEGVVELKSAWIEEEGDLKKKKKKTVRFPISLRIGNV